MSLESAARACSTGPNSTGQHMSGKCRVSVFIVLTIDESSVSDDCVFRLMSISHLEVVTMSSTFLKAVFDRGAALLLK